MKTYQIKAKAKSVPQARIDIIALVSINSNIYDAIEYLKDDVNRIHNCDIYHIDDIRFIEESPNTTVPKVKYLNPI
jgi:hypothetical protein